MIWDNTKGYQEYKESLGNIKNSLGLTNDDSWFLINQDLAPYITSILKWISGKLIEQGENADIKEKLELVFDLFENGSEKIIALEGKSLAEEIGIETEKLSSDDSNYLTYEQDRFIFSWTNILSSLVEHLKLQYASVLQDPIIQGCPCSCGKGETIKDWESYTSGVYPEDEEYSEYGLRGVPSTTSPISECTCAYRK